MLFCLDFIAEDGVLVCNGLDDDHLFPAYRHCTLSALRFSLRFFCSIIPIHNNCYSKTSCEHMRYSPTLSINFPASMSFFPAETIHPIPTKDLLSWTFDDQSYGENEAVNTITLTFQENYVDMGCLRYTLMPMTRPGQFHQSKLDS